MAERKSSRVNRTESKAWHERDPVALEAVKRIASEHPSSLAVEIDAGKRVRLVGTLQYAPSVEGGTPDFVPVSVELAPNHPRGEPRALDVASRFPSTPEFHKFSGDRFCLWFWPESPWAGDDESLRGYLDQLVVHVHRSLICLADPEHRWPGEERPHTSVGALGELFVETLGSFDAAEPFFARWRHGYSAGPNDACACGSGRKWKRCHRAVIEDFERRCGGVALLRAHFQKSVAKPKEAA